MFKFRSMREGADEEKERLLEFNEMNGPLFKMREDPRTTRVGRFLRRFSLDELPQLFNVLRGEMSLVGPRPHTSLEVAQYQDWQKQVLEAPPGMTGLAQVSGRSQLSFDEQCLLDIYYIENWSPALDCQDSAADDSEDVIGRRGVLSQTELLRDSDRRTYDRR